MRILKYSLLLLIVVSSCNFSSGRRVRGNGNLAVENRSAGAFAGIRLLGSMDVILNAGTTHAIKIEADENLLKYISTEVEGSQLVIKSRNGYNLKPKAGLKVYVTAPRIAEIAITGSGSVTSTTRLATVNKLEVQITGSGDAKLDVDAPEVRAEATGSGNIMLAGTTKNFKAEIRGSGKVRSFGLMSENTDVDISGSGNAEVHASKQLDIDIHGSGDVAYKGAPAVHQRISGSGNVHNAQ